MKTNSLKIISTVVVGLFVVGTTLQAQGIDSRTARPPIVAKQISKIEAEKKYPPPKGGCYPVAERDPHTSGQQSASIFTSPYPPHQAYDCGKIPHGGLVLDVHTNKVFVRP
jgi:hypothetical protein